MARDLHCPARMCRSTITADRPIASLAFELARLARGAADLEQLQRTSDAAEAALDEIARVLGDPGADVVPAARAGHLAALALVHVIEAFPRASATHAESLARFRRTALRMLESLERLAGQAARALGARLRPAPQLEVQEVRRARA